MALGIDATIRNAQMDAIDDACNAGSASPSQGKLKIYDGSRPATGGAATTLLAELTLDDPAFGAAVAGVLTAGAITGDTSADATGTATWFRLEDSDGTHVLDGDVGTSGSDLNLNTVALTAGVQVDVTSMVLTAGNP